MGVFILERQVTARQDALAVTTYVMNGFESVTDCVETWRIISEEDSLYDVEIYTQEEYSRGYNYHPITATGKALLITKDEKGHVYLRTMPPLMMKLLAKSNIVLVNIVKEKAHDMIFSMDEITRVKKVNENFRKNILFDRPGGVGEYLHSSGTDDDLVEVVLRSKANGSDGIIILYDDIPMSQMQRIENRLWHIPHESLLVNQYSTLHIRITNDSVIRFVKVGGGFVNSIRLGKLYMG